MPKNDSNDIKTEKLFVIASRSEARVVWGRERGKVAENKQSTLKVAPNNHNMKMFSFLSNPNEKNDGLGRKSANKISNRAKGGEEKNIDFPGVWGSGAVEKLVEKFFSISFCVRRWKLI